MTGWGSDGEAVDDGTADMSLREQRYRRVLRLLPAA